MSLKQFFSDKYNRLEIGFFLMYYILFSLLGKLEYNIIEKGTLSFETADFLELIFYGFKSIIPGFVFYKYLIQRYLFRDKYIKFVIGLIIYLILLDQYILYSYLLISKMFFLPEKMITNALKWYESRALLHFSLSYMFREFLVLTALAYFIRSARQDIHIDQLEKQRLIAEVGYLKTQIQPHFFFNTLNSIYALTLQQSVKAAPLIAKHADIMRYMLYMASETMVTLQEEIDFLKNYVEVEATRYSERITIDFEVQGITPTSLIEPLLFLPFIENTFKHGISEELDKGFISIILSQVDNELSVEVNNSKPTNILKAKDNGIGLKNIRKRLFLLYPQRHSLKIKDEPGAYSVFLTLTLKSK